MSRYAFLGQSVRLNQSPCPQCRHPLNGIAPAALDAPPVKPSDWTPTPDSFTVCAYCASILRFEEGTRLRKATPDDLIELVNGDPEIFSLLQTMVSAAQALLRERRRSRFGSN